MTINNSFSYDGRWGTTVQPQWMPKDKEFPEWSAVMLGLAGANPSGRRAARDHDVVRDLRPGARHPRYGPEPRGDHGGLHPLGRTSPPTSQLGLCPWASAMDEQ